VYNPGEIVTVIFTNTCDYTIDLNCMYPWRIRDSRGQIVFEPEAVLWVIVNIEPGEALSLTWDQKRYKKQVPEGVYTVELDTMNAGTYTTTFEIRESAGATLTVQASDFANSITGVPIKVQPADLNGQADGTTPFTRQYNIGDRVQLEVKLTDPVNCAWNTYVFHEWRADEDAKIVSITGECENIVEIEITGPNPRITAFFEGGADLCARLSTDKQVCCSGEIVTIIFTNNCIATITLNYPDPWLIKNSEDRVVAGIEIQETIAIPVKPGETRTWSWHQIDILTKKQAQDDIYTVEITTIDTGTLTVRFEIKTTAPDGSEDGGICLGSTFLGMLALGAKVLNRKNQFYNWLRHLIQSVYMYTRQYYWSSSEI
jgi:hypothetical protein